MYKELNMTMAKESGKDRFRLLAAMNSDIWIFMWCDEEDNFLGMATENMDDYIVDYTFDELPGVIDNAQSWLNRANKNSSRNQSKLFVMAIK